MPRIYLSSTFIVTVLFVLALVTTASAKTTNLISFSPYTDFTMNAYWDPNYNDMEPMDLTKISQASGVKNYHLAFITDAGNCSPAWGSQSTYSASAGWGKHLTDKLQADKIGYVISFGGANGDDLSHACSLPQLIAAYEQIVQTYQPQGIDFDIENGTADVDKLMTALMSIQKEFPNLQLSFTLPSLPEGLTGTGQNVVTVAKQHDLSFSVNIMAMDYGPGYMNDMGQYAIQAATSLYNFLQSLYPEKSATEIWQMVQVTPMIGVNDTHGEQFTLENVDTLRQFAVQNNLGLLSMWSVTRDNPCASEWASSSCSGNNLQTKPNEFAERFIQQSNTTHSR